MRIGRRWTTLVKLPLALSGRRTLNSEPVAGAICSMWPCSFWPSKASTEKVAGWPMRIFQVWPSLKLATTHKASGTRNSSCEPAVTYWPRRTEASLS
ncbi:hypothetical protein D3C71_1750440 [compost metagenome]